ncbi:uncharacterized protein RCC_11318 [Ramularia collo-cygni]|uniref:Homeobox domain-containing protein n=1 Tax=Ramularia collo-cygni TaxID=112498 RepID=A0A2D3VQK8_9PEZI|nr:uncharacterized protein RCC_11318 [Ramularia collo-cygni]CZT25649.1 uncharacterized protein RCC_11318 [Ramularia collo-cygni]
MESLTLDDGQSYHRYQARMRLKDHRHPPRLPTPETSRSGNDSQSPPDSSHPARDPMLRSGGVTHMRHDSHNSAGQPSPPYRQTDMQKLSLPPLKTILGDSITSPPRTPSPNGNSLQPSPREPLYTALTYKPPSLYPNKKQRTDSLIASAPSYSHFAPSATLEPQHHPSSMRSNVRFPPISQMPSMDARRGSSHSVSTPHSAVSPSWTRSYPSATNEGHRPNQDAARHYQTPEQTPTSAVTEPFPRMGTFAGAVQDPFARDLRGSFAHPDERSASRRSSAASVYSVYHSRPYDREPSRTLPYHQGSRYPGAVRDGYPENGDSAHWHEQQPRSMDACGQNAYPSNVPAFFMPSHYEYQHGKARKRSNLPKQSTEIMKTWFDQNITNPYPSEEQKAIFSSATGISMTQVSNWFINHRRRCPELRDKREKSRGGSRDMDM